MSWTEALVLTVPALLIITACVIATAVIKFFSKNDR